MVRLSLANCPRFNFFPTALKGDEVTAIFGKLQGPTTPVQKITLQSMDKIELYQGIDLTRNKILITVINDVVAG